MCGAFGADYIREMGAKKSAVPGLSMLFVSVARWMVEFQSVRLLPKGLGISKVPERGAQVSTGQSPLIVT